ncbi:11693_t:CDS:1, partial [Diversispora eburnea]
DKGMDNFLDRVHKENVSNEIREKKKLQDQEILPDVKASSYHEASQEEKQLPLNHNEKISQSIETSPLPEKSNLKIPYNQKVERGLRHELFICTKDNNNKIKKVFDIQISEK